MLKTRKYFKIKDVSESIEKSYKLFYESGSFPPLIYFFSHWESKNPDLSLYLKSIYNHKNNWKEENRELLLEYIYSKNVSKGIPITISIIKKKGRPSLEFTKNLELLSVSTSLGVETKTWADYYVFFSKNWEKSIIDFQTYYESKEIVETFVDIFNKNEERRAELYPEDDVGPLKFSGGDLDVIKSFHYILSSDKTDRKVLTFRKPLDNLASIRSSWNKLQKEVNNLSAEIEKFNLGKKDSAVLDKTNQKKFKEIAKRIKKEKLLQKLHNHFKEEYDLFKRNFLDELSDSKIKNTLDGTTLKLTKKDYKERTEKIRELFYVLLMPRLYYVCSHLLYVHLVSNSLEYFSSLSTRGEIKTVSSLKKQKSKSKKKSKKKLSTLKKKPSSGKQKGSKKDPHTCPLCGSDVPSDADKCPGCGEPVMECPNCGEYIDTLDNECPNCGTKFKKSLVFECPNCGEEVSEFDTECPNCGAEFED